MLSGLAGWRRCRACHGLAHGSTRETEWQQARRRTATLRARLGELAAAEDAAFAGLAARHEALLARFEREHGKVR